MRLLLDTHVLVWLKHAPGRVPNRLQLKVAEADAVFVSVASAWEHGIKRRKMPSYASPFDELVAGLAYEPLDLDFACHRYAETLPPIHSDPFDRMLVAQALHHGLTLVTSDRMIRRYAVETLW